jgi:hypothetical protein
MPAQRVRGDVGICLPCHLPLLEAEPVEGHPDVSPSRGVKRMEAVLMWGFWYLVLYLTVGRATSITFGPLRINYGSDRGNQYGDRLRKLGGGLPRRRDYLQQLDSAEDKRPRRRRRQR